MKAQRFVGGTMASMGAVNMAQAGVPGGGSSKMEWATFSLNALITIVGAIAALIKENK